MTEQEALKDIIESGIELGAGDFVNIKSLKIAVKALEKQIPKKPIEKPTRSLFADIRCPDCKTLIGRHQKFCKECGQALDWSDI